MPIKKLLFIDTNIWLDFYRARNDAGLALLRHAEAVADRIVVTFQLESEFKKNRQTVILEGIQELKAPAPISRPGLFSDAKAADMLNKSIKQAEKQVRAMKTRLTRALDDPAHYDPVYKGCQRIFHKGGNLVLTRDDKVRHLIRRKALRRFLHGCPPRKKNDTAIGDAFNWEWMIYCATANNAELVIVSRDSDYGVVFENVAHVNDHLKQEFGERVSKKRKLLLYTRLSEALKHFAVPVTPVEESAEHDLIEASKSDDDDIRAEIERLLGGNTLQHKIELAEKVRKIVIKAIADGREVLGPRMAHALRTITEETRLAKERLKNER